MAVQLYYLPLISYVHTGGGVEDPKVWEFPFLSTLYVHVRSMAVSTFHKRPPAATETIGWHVAGWGALTVYPICVAPTAAQARRHILRKPVITLARDARKAVFPTSGSSSSEADDFAFGVLSLAPPTRCRVPPGPCMQHHRAQLTGTHTLPLPGWTSPMCVC